MTLNLYCCFWLFSSFFTILFSLLLTNLCLLVIFVDFWTRKISILSIWFTREKYESYIRNESVSRCLKLSCETSVHCVSGNIDIFTAKVTINDHAWKSFMTLLFLFEFIHYIFLGSIHLVEYAGNGWQNIRIAACFSQTKEVHIQNLIDWTLLQCRSNTLNLLIRPRYMLDLTEYQTTYLLYVKCTTNVHVLNNNINFEWDFLGAIIFCTRYFLFMLTTEVLQD